MGTAVWHPKWWSKEQHENAWERVKEAMKRDWEQTKADLAGHGKDLDQGVDDTVKQAIGKEAIPPVNQANVHHPHPVTKPIWKDVEEPIQYGYAARTQYGTTHAKWDDKLEGTLKSEWEGASTTAHRDWNDVRAYVRHGYERART